MDSFEVFYDSDKADADKKPSVIVRRVARSRYSELKSLLAKLMASFIYFGCSRGELCDGSNEKVWEDIRKLADMLPLDGGGKLDLDRIDDLQIIAIFFVDEPVEERGRVMRHVDAAGQEHFKPGKIAALHGVNFLDYHERCRGIYGIAHEMAIAWMEEDEKQAKQEEEAKQLNGKVQVPEEELEKLATPTR
jgi:hypothetical protein